MTLFIRLINTPRPMTSTWPVRPWPSACSSRATPARSSQAGCDGPSALPLDELEAFLTQIEAIDDVVKSMPTLTIK